MKVFVAAAAIVAASFLAACSGSQPTPLPGGPPPEYEPPRPFPSAAPAAAPPAAAPSSAPSAGAK